VLISQIQILPEDIQPNIRHILTFCDNSVGQSGYQPKIASIHLWIPQQFGLRVDAGPHTVMSSQRQIG